MTKYGSTSVMQELAWGGAKASVPARVTAVQNLVTSLINNVLGRTEDYTTVPESVDQIANIVGSEVLSVKGQKLTIPQILDMIKVLSDNYRDEAPEGETNWGNVQVI